MMSMSNGSHNPHADENAAIESSASKWAGKKVFTTGEAAEICKVSQQTIIRCFDAGRLQGFRVPGSRFRRIPRDELIRFMQANEIPLDMLEGSQKRILVVDDDHAILELFVDALGRDNRYEVQTASTGYDAGMLTESFRPHLIVLDYMLPDINGNIVCQRLKARDDMANTRIIFVSGVVGEAETQQLLSSGADAFLKKPFRVEELKHRIEELLEA
ncbi:MAG: response regulator [Phycisphaerales bacterium]|nr:response regulator [Phycisphaerales bacterium]